MRAYVPMTVPALRAALQQGEVPAGTAYAVTPGLREWYAEGDIEELEYAALTVAARESLRLLAADPGAPPRRVVLAVEADGAAAPDAEERGSVTLTQPVPWRRVDAGHVDDEDAAEVVAAATAAIAAADAGDDDAAFVVDEADAHELQWYATQELPDVV